MQSIYAGFMRLSYTTGRHRLNRYVMSDDDTDVCDGVLGGPLAPEKSAENI